jgi:hypothetical protein
MGIRVVPNETVPAVVYRVLLPHERRVITVRLHPGVLALPSLVAVGGLIAAAVLSFLDLSSDALAITWVVWGAALLYWLFRIWNWLESYFVLTSSRLLLIRGFLGRDVEMMPLSMATQLTFRRSSLGRLLGYGRFIFEGMSLGPSFRNVNYLPYPEQLYIEVSDLIFPDPGEGAL